MGARFLKAVAQLVYVTEADGELIEVASQPVPFTAAAWRALSPELAALADQGAAAVDAQYPEAMT